MLLFITAMVSAQEVSDTQGASETLPNTFFSQFVIAGGTIVWFILLPMSVATIYLSADNFLNIRRYKLAPIGIGKEIVSLINKFGVGQVAARLSGRKDFVSSAIVYAIAQAGQDIRAALVRNLVAESLQEQALGFTRRIEWLNIIGSVAPMVGLFGTVFGMIKAFNGIVAAGGQPQPAQLAEGISIALVTTFWGLLVAIPALAVHGVFRNRVETFVSEASIEAETVLAELKKQTTEVR